MRNSFIIKRRSLLFSTALLSLHSGKLLEVSNVLEEDKNFVATRSKHIVLADLHG